MERHRLKDIDRHRTQSRKTSKDSGSIQERHQVISLDRLAETVEDVSSKTLGELTRADIRRDQKKQARAEHTEI